MERIVIVQGEHLVVARPGVVISTVLGSCVAVCLVDRVAGIGGINHFLLGEPAAGEDPRRGDQQRYGVHAMELLINSLLDSGASRTRLAAHVYGGATIIAGLGAIGSINAAFARRFLEVERIPTIHAELGGARARRVEFMPHEGRSRCRAVNEVLAVVPAAPAAFAGGELELF